jgi:uncharacterized membrane protein YkoI
MDTTFFRKRNVVVLIVTALIVSVVVSTSTTQYIQHAGAQTSSNITTGMMGGNKLNMTIGASGPNITGSVSLAPLIAKAIASRVNVSLVNAATIAEKAVGTNAHAVSVRLAAVHGFLVYRALVVDSNYGFHTVLVDAGNGKVLSSAQLSIANMLMHRGMLMRNGIMSGSGTGIAFGHASNTTGLKRPTQ